MPLDEVLPLAPVEPVSAPGLCIDEDTKHLLVAATTRMIHLAGRQTRLLTGRLLVFCTHSIADVIAIAEIALASKYPVKWESFHDRIAELYNQNSTENSWEDDWVFLDSMNHLPAGLRPALRPLFIAMRQKHGALSVAQASSVIGCDCLSSCHDLVLQDFGASTLLFEFLPHIRGLPSIKGATELCITVARSVAKRISVSLNHKVTLDLVSTQLHAV